MSATPRVIPIRPAAAGAASPDTPFFEPKRKVYARAVSGRFDRWRQALVVLTQLLFYGLPWFTWNGRQAVLFDLAARKFYLFGLVLWPQDIVYLAVLLVLSALALFRTDLAVMADRRHQLMGARKLQLKDLMQERWTLSPPDSFLGRIV